MDYHKLYLEYKIKYFELKKQYNNQNGGSASVLNITPGYVPSYTSPLFRIGERVENTMNYNSGIIKTIRQLEKSIYTPGVYENYYEVKYDNGSLETVSENVLIRSNNFAHPSILNPLGPIIPPKKYKPNAQQSVYDPYNLLSTPYYQPPLYKPTIYYDDTTPRKSSKKLSRKSSKKSSRKSRK